MQNLPIKLEMIPPWAWAVLAGAGVYVAWQLKNKGVAGVTAGVVTGAAGAVGDLATGVVKGTGAIVGIPDTDGTECAAAMAEGRTWAASLYCPAATFTKYLLTPAKKATTGTVKPAGKASPAVGGVKLDGTIDMTTVTGYGPSFQDLSTEPVPLFDTGAWVNEKNGGKEIVPVAGMRG